MGPRPPERGVDMFRNRYCASVTTELSNALAVWTCDSRGPAPNTAAFALGSPNAPAGRIYNVVQPVEKYKPSLLERSIGMEVPQ